MCFKTSTRRRGGTSRDGGFGRAFSDFGHWGLFSCLRGLLMAGWMVRNRNRKDPQRRCQPLGVGKGAGRSGEGNVNRIDSMSHVPAMIYALFVKRPFTI